MFGAVIFFTIYCCIINDIGVVGYRLNSVSSSCLTRCYEAPLKPVPADILRATQKVRSITGAGLADCKDAVVTAGCDVDGAVALLMTRGKAISNKKQVFGRDGRIGMLTRGYRGVLTELSCETDFVAKTERFLNITSDITREIFDSGMKQQDIECFRNICFQNVPIADFLKAQSSFFGERISLERVAILDQAPERDSLIVLDGYVHDAAVRGGVACGKLATLIAVEIESSQQLKTSLEDMKALTHSLALHITSERPSVVNRADLSAEYVDRKRRLIQKEAEGSQTLPNYDKMVEGKLQKLIKTEILMEQDYALEESKRPIKEMMRSMAAKSNVESVKVLKFCTFGIGEAVSKG